MTARARLTVDAIMVVTLLAAFLPEATGIGPHEMLSVAAALAGLLHLAFNWNWVVGAAKRWFANLSIRNGASEVLNALLFGSMVMVVLSGFMISQALLPALGLEPSGELLWRLLHDLSAKVTILLAIIHGALHWRWIVRATRGVLTQRRGQQRATSRTQPYVGKHRVRRDGARAVGGGHRPNRDRTARPGRAASDGKPIGEDRRLERN